MTLSRIILTNMEDPNTMTGDFLSSGSEERQEKFFRNNPDFWKKYPYVYIFSDQGVYRYEIFSSYLTKADSNAYALEFSELF